MSFVKTVSLSVEYTICFCSKRLLFTDGASLILDGESLKLVSLKINGSPVSVCFVPFTH